ncbi:28528_t:CDS:2, partial [Racocetra persica]
MLPYRTQENFEVPNVELDMFVDVNSYKIKGSKVLFCEKRYCIHNNEVKKKQSNVEIRMSASSIYTSLEVNLKYIHNHFINSAESLSFWRVDEEVHRKLIKLFNDGHLPYSALHTHEDVLHLNVSNEQEILADRSKNPDYNYVYNLFRQYREEIFGVPNGESMFKHLKDGCGKAALQKYDAHVGTSFILCIVMDLIRRIHERIPKQ